MRSALTKEAYIDRLNEELRQHSDFEEGMMFISVPQGAAGGAIEGYALQNMEGRKELFAAVSQRVFLQYDAPA
jgi:hypothetical protein